MNRFFSLFFLCSTRSEDIKINICVYKLEVRAHFMDAYRIHVHIQTQTIIHYGT